MDSEFDEEFVSMFAADPLPRIVSLDIPLTKTTRHIHVALDAYLRTAVDKTWRAEGELQFTKFGSPVSTIPIIRGNTQTPGWTTRQAGGGTQQPSIIYEAAEAPPGNYYQTSVEIPSWQFQVEADRVRLYVKSIRDDSGGTSVFVAGLRIQSQ